VHSLQEIQRRYTTIEEATVYLHKVQDNRIAEFSEVLGEVSQSEAVRESDRWQPVLGALRRYFFYLRAIPLPAGAEELFPERALESLPELVGHAKTSYPQVSDAARRLLECVRSLTDSNYAPILEDLKSTIDGEKAEAGKREVVLLETRSHIDCVRSVLDETFEDRTLNVRHFKDTEVGEVYSSVYVIGRPWWFPDWLFQSPRAKKTFIFSFAWHRDSIDLDPALDFEGTLIGSLPRLEERKPDAQSGRQQVDVDLEQLEQSASWEYLIKNRNIGGDDRQYDKSVEAELLLLDNQNAVFVPASPDHKLLLFDIEETTPTPVRVPLKNVHPGDFILLRIEGEGDLLIPVANAIMGDRAEELREMQIRWKKKLEGRVKERDIETVAIELLERGAEKANESNLRNWISRRRIKPGSREDFEAIMRLIGLSEEEENYWEAMKAIESAHLRAGHRITDLLLERVKDANVERLRRTGRMDFSITDEGGQMTALRISKIPDETFEVPRYETKVPFSVE